MPLAAKALDAALGFAVRGVEVAVLAALVALALVAAAVVAAGVVAAADAVVLSEKGTVIDLDGSSVVILLDTPELGPVTMGALTVVLLLVLMVVVVS